MSRFLSVVFCFVVVCLSAWGQSATAAAGGIPIAQPRVIETPGHYLVVRNISHAGTVIVIQSSDVTLDLNGFTLENTTNGQTVIQAVPNIIENVTITNGIVRGGQTCLYIDRTTGLTVHGIQASGCEVGFFLDDNKVAAITDNRVSATSLGIYSDNCSSCRISDNLLVGGLDGGILFGFGYAAEISRNRITESLLGIQVEGIGLQLRDNVVANCADAMVVKARNSQVSGNLLSNNGNGLSFVFPAEGNVYRGNTSRGNGIDFADDGIGNSSNGDNFMPDRM